MVHLLELGISEWSLIDCLRRWKKENQIEKDATTELWTVCSNRSLTGSIDPVTTVRDRARITGLSRTQQMRLDAVARDRRDLLKPIAGGKLSIQDTRNRGKASSHIVNAYSRQAEPLGLGVHVLMESLAELISVAVAVASPAIVKHVLAAGSIDAQESFKIAGQGDVSILGVFGIKSFAAQDGDHMPVQVEPVWPGIDDFVLS